MEEPWGKKVQIGGKREKGGRGRNRVKQETDAKRGGRGCGKTNVYKVRGEKGGAGEKSGKKGTLTRGGNR